MVPESQLEFSEISRSCGRAWITTDLNVHDQGYSARSSHLDSCERRRERLPMLGCECDPPRFIRKAAAVPVIAIFKQNGSLRHKLPQAAFVLWELTPRNIDTTKGLNELRESRCSGTASIVIPIADVHIHPKWNKLVLTSTALPMLRMMIKTIAPKKVPKKAKRNP
jgi:hypothetical protein